ncbi:hypothetical protein E2562_025574 [Oryza meyeriana var. granulata]|uniref:Uncharacterized protein n=1 Tax=Oryza meyeriana var. granulata TaxID=110450 RepID=A0A6G1E1H8_9ORYZ|nr:hypothetical protein E2562_025574 [Oryza meyeriana var. granulata]
MAQSLELLLIQFLMPDNDARQQAEEQIRRLARDPQVVPALVHHLRTAKTPNIFIPRFIPQSRRVIPPKTRGPPGNSVMRDCASKSHRCLAPDAHPPAFATSAGLPMATPPDLAHQRIIFSSGRTDNM